ncbi:MAG: spore protease YyaC [Moorellaceae bacterium]
MVKAQCFYHEPQAAYILGWTLRQILRELISGTKLPPIIVCIGTDRSTGDSLGPLVGTFLQERHPDLPVYGTLAEPLHAANLEEMLGLIRLRHAGRTVVAVDSALGKEASVGKICVCHGALRPGLGLNKILPQIGDVHLMGIIGAGAWNVLDYLTIQNVKLHLVWQMARVMAEAIEIGAGVRPLAETEAAVALETYERG